MSSYNKLKSIQEQRKTNLCIGLDTDLDKIPKILGYNINSIFEFNKKIIDATCDITSAYKINFAFYELYGAKGFDILEKTRDYIPDEIFTIADAKRGDIGNTSKAYAKSIFDYFGFDSVTVNPYMGYDSIEPFLDYLDNITFVLALTSNPGSNDFQRIIYSRRTIYKHVMRKFLKLGAPRNTGFVVGATHPDELSQLRKIAPDNYFLIPGIGTQGGNIEAVIDANASGPAVINVSRDIIYSSNREDFAEKARERAEWYKMKLIIDN